MKARHQAGAFTGEGSRLHGGRWTTKGRRAIYTSATASLAALAMLVHIENPAVLPAYVLFPVDIPEELIGHLDASELPHDWQLYPAPARLQVIGDRWLDSREATVLAVPSVIIPGELNYLLNPEHQHFNRIVPGDALPFSLDPRLRSRKG